MIRYVWRITRNAQDAEDALQTALLAVWKNRTRVVKHAAPPALIMKMCADAACSIARRRAHRRAEKRNSPSPQRANRRRRRPGWSFRAGNWPASCSRRSTGCRGVRPWPSLYGCLTSCRLSRSPPRWIAARRRPANTWNAPENTSKWCSRNTTPNAFPGVDHEPARSRHDRPRAPRMPVRDRAARSGEPPALPAGGLSVATKRPAAGRHDSPAVGASRRGRGWGWRARASGLSSSSPVSCCGHDPAWPRLPGHVRAAVDPSANHGGRRVPGRDLDLCRPERGDLALAGIDPVRRLPHSVVDSYEPREGAVYHAPIVWHSRAPRYQREVEALAAVLQGEKVPEQSPAILGFLGSLRDKTRMLEQHVERMTESGHTWLEYRLSVADAASGQPVRMLVRVDAATKLPSFCAFLASKTAGRSTSKHGMTTPLRGPTTSMPSAFPRRRSASIAR